MTMYHVTWEIDVDDDSPLGAATFVNNLLNESDDALWCFTVIDGGTNHTIDLQCPAGGPHTPVDNFTAADDSGRRISPGIHCDECGVDLLAIERQW